MLRDDWPGEATDEKKHLAFSLIILYYSLLNFDKNLFHIWEGKSITKDVISHKSEQLLVCKIVNSTIKMLVFYILIFLN